MAQPILTLTIPEIGPSANEFYAGMHPYVRKRIANQWHTLLLWIVKDLHIKPITVYPLIADFRIHFGKDRRCYDSDNCAPSAKLVLDGLVRARVLKGDSPRYVASTHLTPVRGNGKSFIELTLSPVEDAA